MENREIDIIKNMKTIEWLKVQLLNNIGSLYDTLASGENNTKENLEDLISNQILNSYLLGKRLGLSYEGIQSALKENIKINLIEEHKIEKWYGDLSVLLEFVNKHKDKR